MPRLKLRAKTLRKKLRAVNDRTVHAGRIMKDGAIGGMHKMGIERARYALALPFMLAVIVIIYILKAPIKVEMSYRPDTMSVPRMYEGVALDAHTDQMEAPEYVTLYYLETTWAELEPEEGAYAFDKIAEGISIDAWRARGAKMIFRLMLETSDGTSGIPEWMSEKTGADEPIYSDPVLQEAHMRLLYAVNDYFGGDIAYVELGSLGRGGTWGADGSTSNMPLADVTRIYALQYFIAFEGHIIMSVKPYRETALAGCGLYMPDLNDVDGSWELLDIYMYGGYDEETGSFLRANDDFGIDAPTGGHVDAAQICSCSDMIRMARECRLTYVCVKNSGALDASDLAELNGMLGASFWIRSADWPVYVRRDCSLYVDIALHNDGDTVYPVETELYLALVSDGEILYTEKTDASSTEWLPGDNVLRVRLTVPSGFETGEYSLAASIADEDGNFVPLCMKSEKIGTWSILGSVAVK